MALHMSQTMSQRPSLSSPVRDYGKGTRPRSTQPYYDGEHCDSKVCQRRLLPARILTVSLTTYLTCPCSGMWFLQGQRFENFRHAKPVSAQVSRDKVMQMLHLEFDSNGKLICCDFTEYANQTKGESYANMLHGHGHVLDKDHSIHSCLPSSFLPGNNEVDREQR